MTLNMRPATAADAALILRFITDLAIYDNAEHEVKTDVIGIQASLFGPNINGLAREFQAARADGTISVREMVERVAQFLGRFVRPVPPSHVAVIQTVSQWLSSGFDPDVEELFAHIDKSRSTATRIIRQYFGASPKQLTRKYRALRAAIVLVDPEAPAELKAMAGLMDWRAKVLVMDGLLPGVDDMGGLVWGSLADVPPDAELVFLGLMDGKACFAPVPAEGAEGPAYAMPRAWQLMQQLDEWSALPRLRPVIDYWSAR